MNRVAVLMSVYKNDKLCYLKRSIESIKNQTYQNFHFFIAVDGAVTPLIISYLETQNTNSSISVIFYSENEGLATRLNNLIDLLNLQEFDLIARMDADDISLPYRFSEQVKYLESHDYDIIGSSMIEVDETEKHLQTKVMNSGNDFALKNIVKRCPVNHPTVLMKSHIFADGTRYNSNLMNTQDYELWIRLLAKGYKFGNVVRPLLLFRRDAYFFKRRRFKKVLNEVKFKLNAWHLFSKKLSDLIFIILFFCMRVSPSVIQKLIYKYLR